MFYTWEIHTTAFENDSKWKGEKKKKKTSRRDECENPWNFDERTLNKSRAPTASRKVLVTTLRASRLFHRLCVHAVSPPVADGEARAFSDRVLNFIPISLIVRESVTKDRPLSRGESRRARKRMYQSHEFAQDECGTETVFVHSLFPSSSTRWRHRLKSSTVWFCLRSYRLEIVVSASSDVRRATNSDRDGIQTIFGRSM